MPHKMTIKTFAFGSILSLALVLTPLFSTPSFAAPTGIALSSHEVLENSASGTVVGTLSTTDVDPSDSHTYTLVAGTGDTDNVSFSILGDQLQTAAVFNFEAKSSYSIRVRTEDTHNDAFEKALTITIGDINEAPIAAHDTIEATDEDTPLNGAAPGVLLNDTDVDIGDALTVTAYDATSSWGASVTINADGSYIYDPTGSGPLQALPSGESRTDSFTYTISDSLGATDSAQVSLLVTGLNDAPTATNDAGTTDEDTPFTTGNVLANDTDPDSGDTLSLLSMDLSGTQGSVLNNGDGTFTYNPDGRFENLAVGESTTDAFSYTVSDGNGGASSGLVILTITGLNDLPAADFAAAPLSGPAPLTVHFTDTSTDPDAADSIIAWSWDFGDGSTSAAQNPSHTYNQSGVYPIQLTVTDGRAASDTEAKTDYIQVHLTVRITNPGSGTGTVDVTTAPSGMATGTYTVPSAGTLDLIVVHGDTVSLSNPRASGDSMFISAESDVPASIISASGDEITKTATFQMTRNITITNSGTGIGTVNVSQCNPSNACSGSQIIPAGGNLSLTVADGDAVTLDNLSPYAGAMLIAATTTLADPENIAVAGADISETATFELKRTVSLSNTKTGAGTLSVNSCSPSGAASGAQAMAAGGTVTLNVAENDTLVLSATADAGSVFIGFNGDDTGVTPLTLEVKGDQDGTADFGRTFTLTVNWTGIGSGTVAASNQGGVLPVSPFVAGSSSGSGEPAPGHSDSYPCLEGDVVRLNATDTYPSAGSVFKSWGGDASGTSSVVDVAMGDDKTVTAEFNSTYTLTVSMAGTGVDRGAAVSAGGGADSRFPGGSAPGVYLYEAGDSVSLQGADTHPPNPGCEFQGWTVNSGDPGTPFSQTSNTTTVAVNGDLSITGDFIAVYAVQSTVRDNGGMTPIGTTLKYHGENQLYDISPDGGYVVADVIVDGFSQGPHTEYTFENIDADHTITAVFMLGEKPYEGPPAGDQQIYRASVPPLVLLVMGRNHKLYYEAYNDASDLNGDGALDIRYNPDIEYYGYFDSYKVYKYDSVDGRFYPVRYSLNKKVSPAATDEWSGDFLNYLTMSRIDVLRKVLYGGHRSTDTAADTTLMRSFIPQDAHAWGKEYESIERDGYDIREYTPLELPNTTYRRVRHLFANTTLEDNSTGHGDYDRPLLRVLTDSTYRIWEWVSIERPVAGTRCLDGGSGPDCEHSADPGGFHPGHPDNHAEYEDLVQTYANGPAAVPYGSGDVSQIDGSGNPFHDEDDNYLTLFRGYLFVKNSGYYTFAVDGNDAVELLINGTVAAGYYGGHRRCNCYSHSGAPIFLSAGAHSVEFRHEEATGRDNYSLWWRGPDSADNWVIVPAASYDTGLVISEADVENGLNPSDIDSGGLAFVKQTTYELLTGATPASVITDYVVKVKVCDAGMPETNSKKYPSGVYKPIGLLQRHGESGSMLFGLLSGSFEKCSAGGVLRKTIGPITDEINPNTGEFLYQNDGSVEGIVKAIDSFRINNFRYTDYAYEPGWPDAWVTTRTMNTNEFPDWGNPIAEMMYEGIRYFAGKKTCTTDFDYGSSTSTEDYQLGLPRVEAWDDPFETNDICAKAFMLVLTDINPTYDSDQLPGVNANFVNGFTGTFSSADSPAVALDAQSATDGISTAEGGLGFHYIGQLNSTFDGSCVPKDLSLDGFGDVRGLCPEEPTKQGGYYSAGLAHFARTHDINPGEGEQNILTYVVALASPLPRIEIPLGDTTVTLVPFAKSVGGCLGIYPDYGYYQPTNTIVDFYVESLRPTSGTFRINYEDVEQAADHDMDAICIYEYQLLDDNENPVDHHSNATKVKITLTSEYASGCIIQHMGYVISGTTADGPYLEVVDADTGTDVDFFLDTPPGTNAGDPGDPWDDGQPLPLVTTRIFTAGQTTAATLLENPLWYAAKYGGFVNLDGNNTPNLDSEWDEDGDGVPDTYFYVVNPLKLEQQLNRSFADILARGVSHVAPVVSVDEANRTQSGDKLYMAFFKPMPENYWKGNLKKYGLSLETRSECGRSEPEWTLVDKDGTIAGECDGTFKTNTISYWSTTADGGHVDRGGVGAILKNAMPGTDPVLVAPSGPYYDFRNIYTYKDGGMTRFIHANISNDDLAVSGDLMRYRIINWIYGYTFDTASSVDSTPVAKRDWILGDIIHSEPKIIDYVGANGNLEYRFIAVGANDGMLHIFTDMDATIGGTFYSAGQEVFAFIPGDLLPKLQNLGDPTSYTFFVDGASNLFRSDTKDTNGYFHKTLVFGQRRGGRSYWALDVTRPDPEDWSVKWHITGGPAELEGTTGFEELGYSWSRPLFARLRTDVSTVKDVVVFAGGYDPLEDGFPEPFEDLDGDGKWYDPNDNGLYDTGDEIFSATVGGTEGYDKYNPAKDKMGRGIFVLDVRDGSILFKATYGDHDNDSDETEDVTTGIDQKYAMMKYCFPADIALIPFSPHEIVMYAADVYGQIWKLRYHYFADVSSSYEDAGSTRWTVKRIFAANPGSNLATGDPDAFRAGTQVLVGTDAGRKMFYPPDISYFGNEWTTRPVLYFGTGDRAHPRYVMISNRFYLVTDDDTLADETDLLNVTCNELDEGADADGDGSDNSGDDVIRADLYQILESGNDDCRGLYRILDEQGNCTDDVVDHTGEKALSQPTLFFKNVYLTSYQPIFDDPCNPAGNAFIYALDYSDYTAVFNYDETNDLSGQVRTITDTYRYITGSSIPSGVKVITRQGRAAGVLSAGGALAGAGEGGSTSIPGPPGGVEPLLWWTD